MKNFVTLAKRIFKPVAVIKYLFFPFMMAQAQGTTELPNIIGNQKIVAQAETQQHHWVATVNGLYQINKSNGKFILLTTDNSILPSNHITGICVTKNENVYASTDQGIFRFDGFSYLLISTENAALPTNDFTSIACDENNRIFLGTKNYGVVMMKNYKSQIFDRHNSVLTTNHVTNVYQDENGLIIGELINGNYVAMGNSTFVLISRNQSENNALAKGN